MIRLRAKTRPQIRANRPPTRPAIRPATRPAIRPATRPATRLPRPQTPAKPHVVATSPAVTTPVATSPAVATLPTSKTVALLMGCEYVQYAQRGTMERLPGCHADVLALQAYLTPLVSTVRVLWDAQAQDTSQWPTRSRILQALQTIATECQQGVWEHVVVYYSGHGTQVADVTHCEADGKEECMVPCDFLEHGVLTDATLADVFVNILPSGVHLTCIADSCFSGTLWNLPLSFEPTQPSAWITLPDVMTHTYKAEVVTLSGCLDSQTSASAYNMDRQHSGWRGALTVALQKALDQYGLKATCAQITQAVRSFLHTGGYAQVPELCAVNVPSAPVDIPFWSFMQT